MTNCGRDWRPVMRCAPEGSSLGDWQLLTMICRRQVAPGVRLKPALSELLLARMLLFGAVLGTLPVSGAGPNLRPRKTVP